MSEDDHHGEHEPEQHQHGGMGQRGVTRPMAEMEHHGEGHEDHGPPYSEMRHHMLHMHHRQTLWIYWLIVFLGGWMMAAPATFGYLNEALWVDPSGGRGVWFDEETHTALRAWLMTWSDLVSGALLIVLGWRSLTPNRPVSRWGACFVGIWISLAPLLFWAPTAAAYLNSTLVGALVIGLTVLIPGMPNMILYMKMGPPVPPGWSYNPSSWPQRWILAVLAGLGWLASRYLGAYQLGYLEQPWDPFFGEQTRLVLDSDLSHSWPVSDGALGSFAFTFEFLMAWMGGRARWRTMPWMVTFFGILVIPLGLVHIFLVISQPVTVGAWCTLCLLAAALMLPMIPLSVDEVVAMGQHVRHSVRRGTSLWQAFWKGGPPEEDSRPDERTPELMQLPQTPGRVIGASIWGMSVPWTLLLSAVIGLWLMAAPGVLGLAGVVADVHHLGGALIITVAVCAMGEPIRTLRFVNVLLGLGVAALPWVVGEAGLAAQVSATIAGLLVAVLSIPRGPVKERFGRWDHWVR